MRKKIFLFTTSFFLLSLTVSARVQAATFNWDSTTVSVGIGEEKTLQLWIDTQGKETTGVDVVLNTDPTAVDVISVSFPSGVYEKNYNYINPNGTLKLTSTYTNVAGFYNGNTKYAEIRIRGKKQTSTPFSFGCQQSATSDTNILERGTGNDLINCSMLANVTLTVLTQTSGSSDGGSNSGSSNSSGSSGSSPASTPCVNAVPSNPSDFSAVAKSSSTIQLSWNKASGANNYSIQYGTRVGIYQYGASNIGDISNFLVGYLKPGTTYYFGLHGSNGCSTSAVVTAQARTSGRTSTVIAQAPLVVSQSTVPVDVSPSFENQLPLNSEPLASTYPISADESLVVPTPIATEPLATPVPASRGLSPTIYVAIVVGALALIAVISLLVLRARQSVPEPIVPYIPTPEPPPPDEPQIPIEETPVLPTQPMQVPESPQLHQPPQTPSQN